jgi:hypothetical protein
LLLHRKLNGYAWIAAEITAVIDRYCINASTHQRINASTLG